MYAAATTTKMGSLGDSDESEGEIREVQPQKNKLSIEDKHHQKD